MPKRNDQSTTVAELRTLIDEFVRERDWSQFHSPKNLSMALAIEAAELMEHFQWLNIAESRAVTEHPEKVAAVAEELADVLAYTLAMANSLGIDLSETITAKMVKNGLKYPPDEYRGRHGGE
jgi:NTP pyrophosphatase (non-canonical NTP hydrolase)